jgi:ParB family transcriptional regulator, chromosome partitioning protein
MTEDTTIPLNKLAVWPGNVRKTESDTGIEALSASIAAHGLLQSLVVLKAKRGKFTVVAGGRRLRALQALAAAGSISDDYPVRCHVLAGDVDGGEISLAENVIREPMHPADEFDAFLALSEGGMPAADIGARFGVSEVVVKRRLKLARVSPAIIAAFRAGELSLEDVMAFAAVDDHDAQEQVLSNLREGWTGDADDIRAALTENDVPATDRRVRFVTLEAYEQAGGTVRRDLFVEGERGIAILNVPLLDWLATEKLQEAATQVRAEGWKWVETRTTYDWSEWSSCKHARLESVPLTPDEDAEYQRLSEEQERIWDSVNDDEAEAVARLEQIEARISELEDREEFYSPQALANAGVLVTIGHDGDIDIRRGLVLPEDAARAFRNEGDDETHDHDDDDHEAERPALAANLVADLTAERSLALSAMLAQDVDVALAAVVHALVSEVLGCEGHSCLQISATAKTHRGLESAKASTALDALRTSWGDTLPGDAGVLWIWCLLQDRETLLELLALCAATTVHTGMSKGDVPDTGRLTHGADLARAVGLDMRDWFTPTAANYFGRVSKPLIIEALREATGTEPAPAWEKLKKADLAALAETRIAGTGWLPALLRPVTEDDTLAEAA